MPFDRKVPAKNNPDNKIYEDYLLELNAFREELVKFSSDPLIEKAAEDAIKVVDCLRFIKVNLEDDGFIKFAFINKDDPEYFKAIYVHDTDHSNGVLRDHNNTSFHLNSYHDYTNCLLSLSRTVQEFENAIVIARQYNQLTTFINKIRYDEQVGCMEARTKECLDYAVLLEGEVTIINLDQLFSDINSRFKSNNNDIQIAIEALSPKFGTQVRYNGKVATLSKQVVIEYMKNLGYEYEELPSLESTTDLRTPEYSLQLIKEQRALAKMISCPYGHDNNILFLTRQLKDPANYRPIKALSPFADRTTIWDTKLKKWIRRELSSSDRGVAKSDKIHTKKTSTSLVPSHGKMLFFEVTSPAVGFLFDIVHCDLKGEKYVWSNNAVSDAKWWIEGSISYPTLMPTIPLTDLQQELSRFARQGRVPRHNEILAGLSRQALQAIFITKTSLLERLNAVRIRYFCKENLGLDLPILILSTTKEPEVYSLAEQYNDLLAGKRYLVMFDENVITNNILQQYPEIVEAAMFGNVNGLGDAFTNRDWDLVQKLLDKYQGGFVKAQALLLMLGLIKEGQLGIVDILLTKVNEKTASELRCLKDFSQTIERSDIEMAINLLLQQKSLLENQVEVIFDIMVAHFGNGNIPDKLLESLAKISNKDTKNLLLTKSLMQGEEKFALLLINSGADVSQNNNCPLWLSIKSNLNDVTNAILNKGIKKNQAEFAFYLCAEDKEDRVETMELVSKKAKIHPDTYFDRDGNTALHKAASGQKLATIKFLIKKGANIYKINHAGESPLTIALNSNNFQAALLMIEEYQGDFTVDQVKEVCKVLINKRESDTDKLLELLLEKASPEKKSLMLFDIICYASDFNIELQKDIKINYRHSGLINKLDLVLRDKKYDTLALLMKNSDLITLSDKIKQGCFCALFLGKKTDLADDLFKDLKNYDNLKDLLTALEDEKYDEARSSLEKIDYCSWTLIDHYLPKLVKAKRTKDITSLMKKSSNYSALNILYTAILRVDIDTISELMKAISLKKIDDLLSDLESDSMKRICNKLIQDVEGEGNKINNEQKVKTIKLIKESTMLERSSTFTAFGRPECKSVLLATFAVGLAKQNEHANQENFQHFLEQNEISLKTTFGEKCWVSFCSLFFSGFLVFGFIDATKCSSKEECNSALLGMACLTLLFLVSGPICCSLGYNDKFSEKSRLKLFEEIGDTYGFKRPNTPGNVVTSGGRGYASLIERDAELGRC